jgi:hypothetical protein
MVAFSLLHNPRNASKTTDLLVMAGAMEARMFRSLINLRFSLPDKQARKQQMPLVAGFIAPVSASPSPGLPLSRS